MTRVGRYELHLADFHQWAEPLQENFTHVLAENLSILIPTDRVSVFPGRSGVSDYQVTVEVTRFERQRDGVHVLVARWNILRDTWREVLVTRRSSFTEVEAAQDYEAIVSAQSRLLAALSREIVAAMKALSLSHPQGPQ